MEGQVVIPSQDLLDKHFAKELLEYIQEIIERNNVHQSPMSIVIARHMIGVLECLMKLTFRKNLSTLSKLEFQESELYEMTSEQFTEASKRSYVIRIDADTLLSVPRPKAEWTFYTTSAILKKSGLNATKPSANTRCFFMVLCYEKDGQEGEMQLPIFLSF
jgi:hypothetical protein